MNPGIQKDFGWWWEKSGGGALTLLGRYGPGDLITDHLVAHEGGNIMVGINVPFWDINIVFPRERNLSEVENGCNVGCEW